MKYIRQQDYEYIMQKYHADRFTRRDDLFSEDSGMDPEKILSGISENKRDWQNLKTKIRDAASSYLYTATQRSPMILPIINELSEKDFNEEEND